MSYDGAIAEYTTPLEHVVETPGSDRINSKPRNPLDVYNLVQQTCANSEEARGVINLYHSWAFMYDPESASLIEEKLGNMRLPNPEIRKADARWTYEKAMKFYDTAISAHADDAEAVDKLTAEKQNFSMLYGNLDTLVKEGIPTKLPNEVREMEFPTYLN